MDRISMSMNANTSSCDNRRSSEIQGTALGKCLRARTCIYRAMPADVVQIGAGIAQWLEHRTRD